MTTRLAEGESVGEAAEDSAEESPDSTEEGTEAADTTPPGSESALLRRGLVVAVVLAFVAAALGFYRWYAVANDDDIARAEQRDAVLEAADEHIVTLNTLDHADLEAGLQAWLDATAGAMHQDIASITEEDREAVRAQGATSTSRILALGLVDYDPVAETATVIAAVETTVRDADDAEDVKRNRYEADLVFTDDRWLVETLELLSVDVGLDTEPPAGELPPGEDE